jgi:small-conductance mechanosensitive channel
MFQDNISAIKHLVVQNQINNTDADNEKLQRVRDILLGSMPQEIESKVENLEKMQISIQKGFEDDLLKIKHFAEVHTDEKSKGILLRIELLEKKHAAFEWKINAEIKKITAENKELVNSFLAKSNDYKNELDKSIASLQRNFQNTIDELKENTEKQLAAINADKISRAKLAELFSGLSGEIEEPLNKK